MMKYLFIDNKMIESTTGIVELKVNHPDKLGPINMNDEPPECYRHSPYGTIIQENGIYKMWNMIGTTMVLYQSTDGINWTKDCWDSTGDVGAEGTIFLSNIFSSKGGNYHIIYFKDQEGLRIKISEDGLDWRGDDEILLHQECDTQNVCFWDIRLRKYVCYLRGWIPHPVSKRDTWALRAVVRYEFDNSEDLIKHDLKNQENVFKNDHGLPRVYDPEHTVMKPDCHDPYDSDIYTPAVYQYENEVYLAFPSLYRHLQLGDGYDFRDIPNDGILEIQMAISRNGIKWNRFREPYFPLGLAKKEIDCSCVYMFVGMVKKDDCILQYYWGGPNTHRDNYQFSKYKEKYGAIFALRQRIDGFVYLWSKDISTIITNLFEVQELPIKINTDINASGIMKVGILKSDYETMETIEIHGNHLDFELQSIKIKIGDVIRLRFTMENARLYGFEA